MAQHQSTQANAAPDHQSNQSAGGSGIDRRQFLGGVAAAGVGASLASPRPLWAQANGNKETVNLAIVGPGRQGRILLNYALEYLENVNFVAVCDIWKYSRKYGMGLCKRNGHDPNVYEDHREMIAQEKGNIDGVFVAVPDMHHAQISIDCMKAGMNVYCEKEMSTNLEDAARMVQAQRDTGKLLQIGHQRRSNPFYEHALQMIHKEDWCGTMTSVYGQWHQLKRVRPVPKPLQDPKRYKLADSVLKEHGFEDMAHFYYWRWFKETSGGPMGDLGSHQVDIFNWYLEAVPHTISAVGNNVWAKKSAKSKPEAGFEPTQLDHTLVTYQYDTQWGPVNGMYSVVLSSSQGGFYEQFMGDAGAIQTAEILDNAGMHREKQAEAVQFQDKLETKEDGEMAKLKPGRSIAAQQGEKSEKYQKIQQQLKIVKNAPHLPHERNFVEAIRGNEDLNCPADPVGYETAVTALKAHESAVSGEPIQLEESDFHV
jgi:predicted dehydrogenase